MSNTFGNIFRLTTFGESHGPGVGGVVDGFPAGIDIDLDFIQHELYRRRPGQSRITTPRKEADKVELLSGVKENRPDAPSAFWYAIPTNIPMTTTTYATCTDRHMPISPTLKNTACATIRAEDALRHVKP